jgi:hypothetical protein
LNCCLSAARGCSAPSAIFKEAVEGILSKAADTDDVDGMDVAIADEEDLLVQPELDQEPHVQEDWQEYLGLMAHHEQPHVEDGQEDYSNEEGLDMDYDWQEDSRLLRLSEEDKQGLQGWLNMTKIIVGVEEEDNTEVGGLPEDLNP